MEDTLQTLVNDLDAEKLRETLLDNIAETLTKMSELTGYSNTELWEDIVATVEVEVAR